MRPFELGLVIFFGVLGIAGLILIRTGDFSSNDTETVVIKTPIVIWGELSAQSVDSVLFNFAEEDESYRNVSYRYVAPEMIVTALTSALADGRGPDIIIYDQENLVALRNRIQPIPYESFPKRDFIDLYADGASIVTFRDGIYGYPLLIDPLVMYWNRDAFTTAGHLQPPATWEEINSTYVPSLVERDDYRTVYRSVIAMGEYDNIHNAFGIVSLLLIQGGSQLVREGEDGEYLIRLNSGVSTGNVLVTAFSYYTRFSDPGNQLYNWNRTFTSDRLRFLSEDLLLYFGYGSEASALAQANPNLSFDIAEVPQGAAVTNRRTYGRFYSAAVLRSSASPSTAWTVAAALASDVSVQELAKVGNMAPAKRSLLAVGNDGVYGRVIYSTATIARGWLNPSYLQTSQLLSRTLKDVNENKYSVSEAADDLEKQLQYLY